MKQLEFKGSPIFLIEVKGQLGFINYQLAEVLKLSSEGIAGYIHSNKQKFINGIDYYVLNAEEITELKENLSQNNLCLNCFDLNFLLTQ